MPSAIQRFVLAGVFFFFSLPIVVLAEEWTNLRGTVTIEANLLGIWNGRALLRRGDGRQVAVKLEELNADSRIRAQDMQEEIDKTLEERIKELDAIAAEAAAAAPAELPRPKPAPPYVAPSAASDLIDALDHRRTQAMAGHLRVYYDSLPASQQVQADELFKTALTKIDATQYEQMRSTIHKLCEVVIANQKWLFAHPMFERVADSDREALVMAALAFREWGTTENASLEVLSSNSLGTTLTKLDEVAAPYLSTLIEANSLIASVAFPSYEVETGADGKVLAKVVLPIVGTVQSIPMVQLEGKWTEGATAEEAQAKWATYKKDLEAVTNGSVRMSLEASQVLSGLSTLLSQLEQAKTKNEFHRVIDRAAPTLATAINAWAGVKPQNNADVYGSSSSSSSSDPSSGSSGVPGGVVPPP
jgi:hypothetical protein